MNIYRRLCIWLALCAVLSLLLVPAVSAAGEVVHVVQWGENLFRISLRYGVSVAEIAAANGIVNPDCVRAGTRLVIPRSTWPSACWPSCPVDRPAIGCPLAPPPAPASRQPPPPCPQPSATPKVIIPTPAPLPAVWQGQFFASRALAGTPAFTKDDAKIDFFWGYGSPDPRLPEDGFSVRWIRPFDLTRGTYRLTARADDGIRVFIDSVLVIDAWEVQPNTTYRRDIVLSGSGRHTFVVEYFEGGGSAEVFFGLEPVLS